MVTSNMQTAHVSRAFPLDGVPLMMVPYVDVEPIIEIIGLANVNCRPLVGYSGSTEDVNSRICKECTAKVAQLRHVRPAGCTFPSHLNHRTNLYMRFSYRNRFGGLPAFEEVCYLGAGDSSNNRLPAASLASRYRFRQDLRCSQHLGSFVFGDYHRLRIPAILSSFVRSVDRLTIWCQVRYNRHVKRSRLG